jgi:predicted ATPase
LPPAKLHHPPALFPLGWIFRIHRAAIADATDRASVHVDEDLVPCRTETRLVTLTGPGGVGQTRLALEAAWALHDDVDAFPDGVWFVRLAPLTDPELAILTLAQTLGLGDVR